jgi:hypothetical protein
VRNEIGVSWTLLISSHVGIGRARGVLPALARAFSWSVPIIDHVSSMNYFATTVKSLLAIFFYLTTKPVNVR